MLRDVCVGVVVCVCVCVCVYKFNSSVRLIIVTHCTAQHSATRPAMVHCSQSRRVQGREGIKGEVEIIAMVGSLFWTSPSVFDLFVSFAVAWFGCVVLCFFSALSLGFDHLFMHKRKTAPSCYSGHPAHIPAIGILSNWMGFFGFRKYVKCVIVGNVGRSFML